MRRLPRGEITARVARALDMVRLGEFGARMPGQLSGGQQQRVALARAAVYDPPLLLMDEPLGALDKNLREEMQEELRQFHRNVGATILYVTHDQQEAASMADRIAIINHGVAEQVGPPHEVYERPANTFVARFLGEANMFRLLRVEAAGVGRVRCEVEGGLGLLCGQAVAGGPGLHQAGEHCHRHDTACSRELLFGTYHRRRACCRQCSLPRRDRTRVQRCRADGIRTPCRAPVIDDEVHVGWDAEDMLVLSE